MVQCIVKSRVILYVDRGPDSIKSSATKLYRLQIEALGTALRILVLDG